MIRPGLTAVAGLLMLTSGAAAQDKVCLHQPAIVSLADSIIEKREELTGFPPRNFGTDAAYLKIRYEPLSDSDAEALLARLIEGRARTIRELAFAWSYGKDDGEATKRLLGDDALVEAESTNSISAMRAMLDAGAEEVLMHAIADNPEEVPMSTYQALLVAAVDLSDGAKASLAKLALQGEQPLLAAELVAIQRKPKAWTGFIDGLADPELIDQATQMWRWAPALVGNPELPPSPRMSPPIDPEARRKVHEVFAVAAIEPQVSFLPTLLNQTGRIDEVHAAAQTLRDAIESGIVARNGPFGPAWLIAYRSLRESWGDIEALESQLGSFQLNVGPAGGASPLSLLDTLIAVEALTPYVNGDATELHEMPDGLSTDFGAWPAWLAAAEIVKAKPSDPALAEEATLPMAAELLLASGHSEELAGLVAGSPASSPLLHLATDAAIRLDRLCAHYLAHPTEALQLNGQQIYKFAG